MEHVVMPAPGWYPDPAGSAACRWWDGSAWTTNLQAHPSVPVPFEPAPGASVSAPAPEYAGDPRFGGPAAAPGAAPSPSAPTSPRAAAHAAPGASTRPTSHVVAAVLGVLVLLVGVVFVGKAVLGGSGSAGGGDAGQVGGLIAPGNPQVAAMKSDVLSVSTAEETLFTDRQAYVAATSAGRTLKIGAQSLRLSAPGEAVSVVLSPSGVGYCIRAARTPAGGGAQQVVLYVSTQGGLQPGGTTCPAVF